MTNGEGLPREAREQIEGLVGVVSQPEFADMLHEIEGAPTRTRAQVAQRLATVDELRNRNLEIPEGLRITTRVFENPDDPRTIALAVVDEREVEDISPRPGEVFKPTVCVSIGKLVCVSIGN